MRVENLSDVRRRKISKAIAEFDVEVIMLARQKDEAWSLTPHEDREYSNSTERAFFEAIENPPLPSQELIDMYATYGKYLNK